MTRSKIGRGHLEVSRLGLGCVTFGREIDERQSFAILDYAFEKGINLFDTAEAYGGESHASEKILGRWLRSTGLRSQVVVQTKITRQATRQHLPEALGASLERLQTDYTDIYLFHSFDTNTPLDESMEAMAHAVVSGAVKLGGCSNFSFDQLQDAQKISPGTIQVIQPIYNLVRREIESDILPFCEQHGIAPITYSPLGAGFLAGKYQADAPLPAGTRFDIIPGHTKEYFSDANFTTVEKLRALSVEVEISMVRLAMAWALHRPRLSGVLIGARNTGQIDNALEALQNPLPADLQDRMTAWQA